MMALAQLIKSSAIPLVLFLFMVGLVAQWPVTQHLILHRHCTLKYDADICDKLHMHKDIQNEVQSEASQFMTYQSLFNDIPGAIMALILGAASDKYGRKRIMMLPCIGGIGLSIALFMQLFAEGISLKYFALGGLLWGSCGGVTTFISAITNYVTDTTPEEARTQRLSKIFPFMGLGAIAGILLSGGLSETAAYCVLLVCSITSTLVVYFFVDDIRMKSNDDDKGVVEAVKTNIYKGAQILISNSNPKRRKQLWSVLFSGLVGTACVFAEGNLIMFFTKRSPFEWTPNTYGLYSALKQVMSVVGQSAGPALFYKSVGKSTILNDITLVQLGHIGFCAASLVTGLANSNFVLFLGVFLVAFGGPIQPATSSIISRLVPSADKGSYTAFSGFLHSLSMPIGTFVFNNIYSWSVQYDMPAFAFYVMAVLHFIIVILLSLIKDDVIEEEAEKKDR